ncbi:MAG: DUF819 family protein [Bacteroidales bacterium]|nr:DUF819 family protein [Bacteroidales bacterium]
MNYLFLIFWVLFYLLVPAAVIRLCQKVSFFGKVGAILTLYFLGVIVGNLFIFPFEGAGARIYPIQDILTSLTIPLAMPLILFSCDFKHWPVKKALGALLIGLFSVVTVTMAGFYLFGDKANYPGFNKVAGMIIGVYTGGTPNLAAIKMMLNVDETTYVLMNSFDMIVSFLYLTFLMACGIRFFRWLMPSSRNAPRLMREKAHTGEALIESSEETYRHIFTKENFIPTLEAVGLAILIAGIGLGLSLVITGKIDMIILILTLTTLAIAASFLPAVRKMKKSYDAGMYLVLIFSLVVASMVDIRSINLTEGMWLLIYITFAIFGSLLLQVGLGCIFKIDADTTVITSVALINSPLFVPMIADSMKNKKIIITGITIGVIGYAAGNYLGVLVAQLLG